MHRSLLTVAFASLALFTVARAAQADQICYDEQVCEEVCTELTPVAALPSLSIARTPRSYTPPTHCETVCTIEQVCTPEDYTDGGEGVDYSQGELDACYDEPLLADQIRCIQALLAE